MIVGVAAKRGEKIEKMVKPARHYNLIIHLVRDLGWGTPIKVEEQGFYDDRGFFYNREDAYKHADSFQQLKNVPICAGQLFSEDVW